MVQLHGTLVPTIDRTCRFRGPTISETAEHDVQRDFPWYLTAVLFASTSVIVGIIWDISWHRTIGRDSFWTPAHLAVYTGGLAAGLSCGWLALKTTFSGTGTEVGRSVRMWGFRAPLGAWVAIWGAIAMLTSAPLDDWWHNAYGLDVEILSPPHVVLAMGICAIQLGALLMALSWQNRASERGQRLLGFAYAYSAGMLLLTLAVLMLEYSFPNDWRGPTFHMISAGVYPVVFFAIGRAARLRWPATWTALVYMGVTLIMMWVLPLFPAEPLLAPILRNVDRMVAPEFPLVLIVPAIALDLLLRRASQPGRAPARRSVDWGFAALGSVVFVGLSARCTGTSASSCSPRRRGTTSSKVTPGDTTTPRAPGSTSSGATAGSRAARSPSRTSCRERGGPCRSDSRRRA